MEPDQLIERTHAALAPATGLAAGLAAGFAAGAADATFYGSETGEAMGYSVAGGGDLTGDGWPDLVFGGPTARGVGVARVVSGNAY